MNPIHQIITIEATRIHVDGNRSGLTQSGRSNSELIKLVFEIGWLFNYLLVATFTRIERRVADG